MGHGSGTNPVASSETFARPPVPLLTSAEFAAAGGSSPAAYVRRICRCGGRRQCPLLTYDTLPRRAAALPAAYVRRICRCGWRRQCPLLTAVEFAAAVGGSARCLRPSNLPLRRAAAVPAAYGRWREGARRQKAPRHFCGGACGIGALAGSYFTRSLVAVWPWRRMTMVPGAGASMGMPWRL